MENVAYADITIAMAERSPDPSQELDDDAWKEQERIRGLRNAIWDAGNGIRERVRQELAGEV